MESREKLKKKRSGENAAYKLRNGTLAHLAGMSATKGKATMKCRPFPGEPSERHFIVGNQKIEWGTGSKSLQNSTL